MTRTTDIRFQDGRFNVIEIGESKIERRSIAALLDEEGHAPEGSDDATAADDAITKWDDEVEAAQARPKETNPFHVMVDLETFGVGPAAFPIAIGAVKFDPASSYFGRDLASGAEGTPITSDSWDRFYVAVDPRLGPALGLDIQTIMWWMGQDQRPALDRWLAEPKVSLREALDGLAEWYGDESLPTWSRGPAFDAVILETAYKVCGLPNRPWGFRHDRDCRTIRGLMPAGWKAPGEGQGKHNALDDAIYQTTELLTIARELGLTLR